MSAKMPAQEVVSAQFQRACAGHRTQGRRIRAQSQHLVPALIPGSE